MNEDHLARIAEALDTTPATRSLGAPNPRHRVIDDLMEAASQLPPEWQGLQLLFNRHAFMNSPPKLKRIWRSAAHRRRR